MDSSSSSSSPPNSSNLSFSLSSNNHFIPIPSSSDSLFHSYPSTLTLTHTGSNSSSTNLSILSGGSTTTTTTTTTQSLMIPQLISSSSDIYDSELKKTIAAAACCIPSPPKKTTVVDTFGQRTSIYRGVTRHRWTGRYEAHLWDNSCRREGQSRKGRQVYLGGYDKEDKAARAYDLAALKYWGPTTTTNFPISNYEKELQEMKNMSRQEFVASLRRKSSGFSRGASIYRGVTRHHQHGRWQARIGRVAGNKDLYLGTFSTQEEAAEAYDIAAIKFRGLNAVTNFDMSRYDVKSIANTTLPIGGLSNNNNKNNTNSSDTKRQSDERAGTFASHHQPSNNNNTFSFAIPIKQDPSDYWSILGFQNNNNVPSSNNSNSTLQSCGTTVVVPFNMDFSSAAPSNTSTADYFSGFVQQQNARNPGGGSSSSSSSSFSSSSNSNSIPLATPIFSLNSSTSGYENNGTSYGNWIGQSMHTFQTVHAAKPSLFQTPIFGME